MCFEHANLLMIWMANNDGDNIAECSDRVVSNPPSYSGGLGFNSRPGFRII